MDNDLSRSGISELNFCEPDCEHLSPTENEQKYQDLKSGHRCKQYRTRVFHLGDHPKIYRCAPCRAAFHAAEILSTGGLQCGTDGLEFASVSLQASPELQSEGGTTMPNYLSGTLADYSTKELVEELQRRDGVEQYEVSPHQPYNINMLGTDNYVESAIVGEGPALILVVID